MGPTQRGGILLRESSHQMGPFEKRRSEKNMARLCDKAYLLFPGGPPSAHMCWSIRAVFVAYDIAHAKLTVIYHPYYRFRHLVNRG